MGKFDFFVKLKDFVTNKIDSSEFMSDNKRINRVRVDPKDNGKSIIHLDFYTDEKLLKSLGLGEDDISFYFAVKNSRYQNPELYSYYTAQDDFIQGYGVWDNLDEDNWDKFQEISTYIMEKPFSEDSDFLAELGKKLFDMFPVEINDIIHEYTYKRNDNMVEDAEKVIDSDLGGFFEHYNMKFHEDGIVSIEARKLLDFYLKRGVPHYSLEKLFELVFGESDEYNLGGWSDDIWEYGSSESFDKSGFNSSVSNELDNILEKLETDEVKAKKFMQMVQRVKRKFYPGRAYKLPKDKSSKVEFIIMGFDFKENKIVVKLTKELKQRTLKLTEENFNNLLYQPELFKFEEIHNF